MISSNPAIQAKHGKIGQTCAICQPNFLPWLGFFEMADRVDTFILLDDVQYVKHDWMNRNRIPSTANAYGWRWLTVPVNKCFGKMNINQELISNQQNWQYCMIETIRHTYVSADYFDQYFPSLVEVLNIKYTKLIDLNLAIIELIYAWLQLPVNYILSSTLALPGIKETKLIGLCKYFDCNVYVANNGSKSYIQEELFLENHIGFIFQDYHHPVYSVKSESFMPYMSVIDLIFHHGDKALSIIRSGRDKQWLDNINFA